MRLVKVELTRLLWRRAVLVLLVLAIVLPLAVLVLRVVDTRTQPFDDLVAAHGSSVLDEVDRCVRHPRRYGLGSADDVTAACQQRITGWYGNTPLDLVQEREEGGAMAAILLVSMVLLLAGITFAGHDWNTGSMSNQLLFEPRRERVWLAKALAVGLLTAALSMAVLAAFWTGLWVTASVRDLAIPEHAVSAGYKQAVLGAAFATGAAVFGYALTMLLRSTVGALGVLFAVGFFCVVIVAGILGLEGGVERVMPWGNFVAYAVGGYEFYDYDGCVMDMSGGGDCDTGETIKRGASVIYFAVIWVVVAVPSLLSFRARDVP
jgi:ABC-2 type transport system permease protein